VPSGEADIRLRAVTAATVCVVAVVATLLGWLQAPDDLTATEAVRAARSAYAAAGLHDVEVEGEAVSGTYNPGGGDEPVPVWLTSATLGGGSIALWLARADGEAVYLDDRTPDGARQLLTEDQVQALGDHDGSPAVDRQVRRNLVLTVAAALVLLVAVSHARSAARPLPLPLATSAKEPRDRPLPPRPRGPLVAAQRSPGRLRAEER
jgi:hypothetical protein